MAKDKKLIQEIASDSGGNKLPQFGGKLLPNTDDTLRTRGGAKGLKIYDDLERDAHTFSVLQNENSLS